MVKNGCEAVVHLIRCLHELFGDTYVILTLARRALYRVH